MSNRIEDWILNRKINKRKDFFQALAHRTGSPDISVSDNLCTPFDPRSCDRISDRIFRLETGGPAGASRRLSDCSCIRRSAFQKRAKKAQDQKIPETSERTGLVEISSLAERTGLDPEEVLQDLQLFIDRGIYPDGKISEDRNSHHVIFHPEHSNTEPQGKDTL